MLNKESKKLFVIYLDRTGSLDVDHEHTVRSVIIIRISYCITSQTILQSQHWTDTFRSLNDDQLTIARVLIKRIYYIANGIKSKFTRQIRNRIGQNEILRQKVEQLEFAIPTDTTFQSAHWKWDVWSLMGERREWFTYRGSWIRLAEKSDEKDFYTPSEDWIKSNLDRSDDIGEVNVWRGSDYLGWIDLLWYKKCYSNLPFHFT